MQIRDKKSRFIAKKRIAVDGVQWWCIWDNLENKFPALYGLRGKYKTKKTCLAAINYAANTYYK